LGLVEADICWDLAQRLAERMTGAGASIRFTRTESESPDVATRAARANELGADVFLSVHLNSHLDDLAEGASTYHHASSRSGARLAEVIQEQLVALGLKDCRCHPRNYALLRETRMPAVIVEPGFVTSSADACRLDDQDFRNDVAVALTTALRRYYES
jgi:N-acetylmuramoyl-L-alanine amidase